MVAAVLQRSFTANEVKEVLARLPAAAKPDFEKAMAEGRSFPWLEKMVSSPARTPDLHAGAGRLNGGNATRGGQRAHNVSSRSSPVVQPGIVRISRAKDKIRERDDGVMEIRFSVGRSNHFYVRADTLSLEDTRLMEERHDLWFPFEIVAVFTVGVFPPAECVRLRVKGSS
jgi:hypothetical protein